MSPNATDDEIREAAREARAHADNLYAELANTTSRVEHMRITRLAVEAAHLANILETLAASPNVPRPHEVIDIPTHL